MRKNTDPLSMMAKNPSKVPQMFTANKTFRVNKCPQCQEIPVLHYDNGAITLQCINNHTLTITHENAKESLKKLKESCSINLDKKYTYCPQHNDKYIAFCKDHNLSLCSTCLKGHLSCGGKLNFNEISPKDVENKVKCIQELRKYIEGLGYMLEVTEGVYNAFLDSTNCVNLISNSNEILVKQNTFMKKIFTDISEANYLDKNDNYDIALKKVQNYQGKYDNFFKLITIGDTYVGKSNINLRFYSDSFSEENIKNTAGEDTKNMSINYENKTVKLQLLDINEEDEKKKALGDSNYKGAHGLLLVYDISNKKSFKSLSDFMSNIDKKAKNAVKFLIGNKSDIEDRQVPREQAEDFARKNGMRYFECSAKSNIGINEVFIEMVKALFARMVTNLSGNKAKKPGKKDACNIF